MLATVYDFNVIGGFKTIYIKKKKDNSNQIAPE